jgi:DNA-3-methyladenine glycosylase
MDRGEEGAVRSRSRDTDETLAVRPLDRSELPGATAALARFLIGCTVVRELPEGRLAGRIVETEAYLPDDAACHAFRGPTPRNRSLFLERGHAYVYLAYGTSMMLNVSGDEPGTGAGVLLRALEPLAGIAAMERRRGTTRVLDLARGPGRLAQALGIDRALDGIDLCAPGLLWLGAPVRPAGAVGCSVRIGITKDAHRPLRFFEAGSRFVSGPGRLNHIVG